MFKFLLRLIFKRSVAPVPALRDDLLPLRLQRARPSVVDLPPTRVVVPLSPTETVLCGRCWVIDGDTIVLNNVRLRLAGIDAPELDHPWGQRSKFALVQLCKGHTITAHITPELSYDRVVAQCFLPDGRDLAAELVRAGLALDWPRFSGGKYRHLEPPDARKRLWRADARQRGRFPPGPDRQRSADLSPPD